MDFENWLSDIKPQDIEIVDTKAKKKENVLDLPTELSAMDYRKMDFYKNLSDEQKKEISLWLLMRYMSSSDNEKEYHITMVNDIVNVNFPVIAKHPELQWKLLALCGTKKKQFHPWIAPGKGQKKNKLEQELIKFYPMISDKELELIQQINSKEEFKDFFKQNGYDDKTIKELLG